jgi:hypothetical protein
MRNVSGEGDLLGDVQRRALFWPPTKIAGRYLSPYLAELDRAEAMGQVPQPSGQPVDLDLDHDMPVLRGRTATQLSRAGAPHD